MKVLMRDRGMLQVLKVPQAPPKRTKTKMATNNKNEGFIPVHGGYRI